VRLSRLNPVSLLFGPVFQREVRAAGRKRGTYIVRALYGAGLLTIVGIVFMGIRSDVALASGVQRLQRLQTLAPMLAIVIVWFQFAALCLAAPILTGPAICDEKRARTLPALMTTPLSAAQVVLGTLASRLVQLVILSLLATPLLLAIRVFGGLDARVVLAATCMGLSAATLGAALGLMYSVWHKRGTTAAVFALLSLALAMGAPAALEGVLYYVMNDLNSGAPAPEVYPYHQGVLSTCTPVTMGFLTESAAMGREPAEVEIPGISVRQVSAGGKTVSIPLSLPMWVVNSVYNLALALLVTAYTTWAMRRVMLREAGGAAPTRRPRKKRGEAASDDAEPAERSAARSREVSDRPVLWREVRQASLGSKKWARAAAVLTMLGLAVTYWYAGLTPASREGRHFSWRELIDNEGLHTAFMVLGAIVVMIQPVLMTTGSIAGEREAKTWETLLTTPLTGARVVLGKLAGSLRVQWFLPTVILLHMLAVIATGHLAPRVLALLLVTYLGPVLFFSATGQLFSLMFRRAVTAAVCNLGLGLLLWAGSWIALALAAWFVDTGEGQLFDYAGAACFALNPVAMSVSIAEANSPHRLAWRSAGLYEIAGVHTHSMQLWAFGLVVAAVFAFYAIGAYAALALAIGGFRRLSGRSS
jgi:ABC-type transport system involved in multi-copper enzyme maturation permease subunit